MVGAPCAKCKSRVSGAFAGAVVDVFIFDELPTTIYRPGHLWLIMGCPKHCGNCLDRRRLRLNPNACTGCMGCLPHGNGNASSIIVDWADSVLTTSKNGKIMAKEGEVLPASNRESCYERLGRYPV